MTKQEFLSSQKLKRDPKHEAKNTKFGDFGERWWLNFWKHLYRTILAEKLEELG